MKKQLNEDKERCPICKSYDHVNYDDTSGECDKEMKHKSLSEKLKGYTIFQSMTPKLAQSITQDINQSIKRILNIVVNTEDSIITKIDKIKQEVGKDLI
ncbi:hypothetical protein BMS3Abin17_01230 [archaeon BMS3Abin17]|nr:hypothetical protein BMS3Abin17_01230 [archaeon BMS3Abin17]HDZ60434.1 hypothetical protein [Candidatus Pacearchaeota archaeon]